MTAPQDLTTMDADWERALWNDDHKLLQRLMRTESPTTTLFQLERHVRQLYMMAHLTPGRVTEDRAQTRIAQIRPALPDLRERVGGWLEQRAYDLSVLQWIRRNSALSVVLGAGVTMGAGGPSWSQLAERLLQTALDLGREVFRYEKTERGAKARVDRVIRLEPAAEAEARQILSCIQTDRITSRPTDTEMLMRGAQICADLFQESLFQKVTAILYPGGKRQPSAVHRAIAALAHWQPPGGHYLTPGWVSVINYNFDSLMNDALTAVRVPYTLSFMRDRRIDHHSLKGDPHPERSLPIIHLHGFTPREPFFDLRGVDFVFSTKQFESLYGQMQDTIVEYALHQYVSHPAYVALYVGCSFTDEAMNSLLRRAARRFPGRTHYALLKIPERLLEHDDRATLDEVARRYVEMGVRAVWYVDHDEIPGLIKRLA